jgi:ABC-type transport system involved in Fe-S cluster assembly fused permease/ATPase subunit
LATEIDDGTAPSPRLNGSVEFKKVNLSYDGRPALRDISFTASPGELIALVGPSGSGKTTLASLIPRRFLFKGFFEVQGSKVLVRKDRVVGSDVRAPYQSGPVAQLGARLNGIQEVTGSTPVRSTKSSFPVSISRK